ncbi:hypothetical protein [Chryseobacterium wanjuense]
MGSFEKADGARVINVSSYGHQMSPFDFEDPNFENREYHTLAGYGQSKTASNLFAAALDEKAKNSMSEPIPFTGSWCTELIWDGKNR